MNDDPTFYRVSLVVADESRNWLLYRPWRLTRDLKEAIKYGKAEFKAKGGAEGSLYVGVSDSVLVVYGADFKNGKWRTWSKRRIERENDAD